jgi:creatinine amidohydrolase
LLDRRPTVAVLPWGATEAHNFHLPHGTDTIEASSLAEAAAALADGAGAAALVLPAVPFGNNAQQLDQVATIHLRTTTALAILTDVAQSLAVQGIDRLVVLNAHGGNEFKPLVRDVQALTGVLIVVINFWQLIPQAVAEIFDEPGDHAGELETSLLLHLRPEWVMMEQAGEGRTVPLAISELKNPGVWTPRPWSACQPDTGCGNPAQASAEKGRRYFETVTAAIANVLIALARATRGQSPYLQSEDGER